MKSFFLLSIFLFIVYFCVATSGEEEEPFKCEPNEYFKINCNHCHCAKSGKGARCDVEYCDPIDNSKYMERPHDYVGVWFNGCNFVYKDGSTTSKRCSKTLGLIPAPSSFNRLLDKKID